MRAITMPTFRRGSRDEGSKLWGDLRMALHSIDIYGSDFVDEVIVAWDGPWEPDGMPSNSKIKLIRRPDNLDMAAAWTWAIEQTDADEIIMMPDDVVLHPDSLRLMHEDLWIIKNRLPDKKPGILTMRSNFACGAQNIRNPGPNGTFHDSMISYPIEESLIEVNVAFNVMSWFPRTAWEEIGGFPEGLIWFGDVMMSYDLRQLGYSLFVSRGYVHHVGMRGTKAGGDDTASMHEEGVRWLRENRPDFLEYWISQGRIDPSERYATV